MGSPRKLLKVKKPAPKERRNSNHGCHCETTRGAIRRQVDQSDHQGRELIATSRIAGAMQARPRVRPHAFEITRCLPPWPLKPHWTIRRLVERPVETSRRAGGAVRSWFQRRITPVFRRLEPFSLLRRPESIGAVCGGPQGRTTKVVFGTGNTES